VSTRVLHVATRAQDAGSYHHFPTSAPLLFVSTTHAGKQNPYL